MNNAILEIKDLCVSIDDKEILKNINLTIRPGEIHAIMGPNGSGKSTLANILAGHEKYTITSGEINFLGNDLIGSSPDERARRGLFLAFQYPTEIPGVSNVNLLKTALNAKRKQANLPEIDAMDFLNLVKQKLASLQIEQDFLYRGVNSGFSGGEKKRNEILQMAVLEPHLAILDEIDSGLDIDALKIISENVNKLRSKERSIILVTHYQRILNYIEPDFVHVLIDGKLQMSGDRHLALELEAKGYGWLTESA